MRQTLGELARILGIAPPEHGETVISGAAVDSRVVKQGDLFVALRGEHADGHDFIPGAAEFGASAALVSRHVPHPIPQLEVPDPLLALQRIAVEERGKAGYRLAAVTGSVAKTTTKDFLAALMATTFPVGSTSGNHNSEIGLPMELCNQPEGIAWMIAELGMSHAGELDRLGAIALPEALLYTVIAPVHLEFFPDIEAIAEAKAELIPHLRRDGVLVLNGADERVAGLADRFAGRVERYGVPNDSALWIERYASRGLLGSRVRLRGPSATIEVEWPIAGRHQADNLLAAAACALTLDVPADAIAPCASGLRPTARRGEVHRTAGGLTVVDDSYNASPAAMLRLLELLGETSGRRIAVLGEMLELGAESEALHRQVGERAGETADVVVAVGGRPAKALADAVRSTEVAYLPDADGALELIVSLARPGDIVLVKGSRGIHLDRLVDGLLAEVY